MARHYTSTFNTRQNMQSEDMEIFYYEDKLLHPVSSHRHRHYEIYFFISGQASCSIDGQTYPLSYGDVCLMPPGVFHRPLFHGSDIPYRRIVLWISPKCFDELCKSYPEIAYCFSHALSQKQYRFSHDATDARLLFGKLFELLEEYHGTAPFQAAALKCCTASFLLTLNRCIYSRQNPLDTVSSKPLFSQICDYIHSHLEENLTLDLLAGEFYVSKYHIAHIFKENMGISTHQYITKQRLHAGKNMLLSGVCIREAAEYYGFPNYTTFFRAFKKEFGISPKEYRESCLRGPQNSSENGN